MILIRGIETDKEGSLICAVIPAATQQSVTWFSSEAVDSRLHFNICCGFAGSQRTTGERICRVHNRWGVEFALVDSQAEVVANGGRGLRHGVL